MVAQDDMGDLMSNKTHEISRAKCLVTVEEDSDAALKSSEDFSPSCWKTDRLH